LVELVSLEDQGWVWFAKISLHRDGYKITALRTVLFKVAVYRHRLGPSYIPSLGPNSGVMRYLIPPAYPRDS